MRINGVNQQQNFTGFYIKDNGVWKDLAQSGKALTSKLVRESVQAEGIKPSRNIKYLVLSSEQKNLPAILTGAEADEFLKIKSAAKRDEFLGEFLGDIKQKYQGLKHKWVDIQIPDKVQYDNNRLDSFIRWEKQLKG